MTIALSCLNAPVTVGHDVCAPIGTRYIEGLTPTIQPTIPLHPTAEGWRPTARQSRLG